MGLGVLAFVVALLGSIMLHEAGHLLTAKKFGMKATQYFVGFGPTLWSFRRGETEYGVKAIPAGGFVKIVGMTELEEVDRVDEDRAFFRQPPGRRAIVLAAGSFTHFVLAAVLLFLTLFAIGLPTLTTTISRVTDCVTAERCEGQPVSPARAAGLLAGDKVVEFNGQPVQDWADDLTRRVREHPGGPTTIVVERDGQRVTLPIDVAQVWRQKPGSDELEAVGAVGLLPKEAARPESFGGAVTKTASGMGALFAGTAKAIVDIPGQIPDAFRQAFTGEERKAEEAITGVVGITNIAGDAFRRGLIAEFLLLIAGLNVFIGVLNLLPLLPLDGGHLAILGFEQTRSLAARLLGWRDPGRVDIRKLMPAAYLVIVFFAGLTLLLLYSDIVNPVSNPF